MVPSASSECADAGGVLADGVVIHLASSEAVNYLLLGLLGFSLPVQSFRRQGKHIPVIYLQREGRKCTHPKLH